MLMSTANKITDAAKSMGWGQGRYDAYNVIRHELTRHLTEEFRM
jgi:hypothetical protein